MVGGHALKPSQYGRGAGAERDDSAVRCEVCGGAPYFHLTEIKEGVMRQFSYCREHVPSEFATQLGPLRADLAILPATPQ